MGTTKHDSLIHPLGFTAAVVQKRQGVLAALAMNGEPVVAPQATLGEVWVYRGCPSNARNPDAYRRSHAQRSEWTRDKRVQVTYRTLKYYDNGQVREKGTDVLLAINLVEAVQSGAFEVVILAAHDTYQEPALEAALDSARSTPSNWKQRAGKGARC